MLWVNFFNSSVQFMTSQSKLRQIQVHDVHIYSSYAVKMSKHSFYIYYGCQSHIATRKLFSVKWLIFTFFISNISCLYIIDLLVFVLNQVNKWFWYHPFYLHIEWLSQCTVPKNLIFQRYPVGLEEKLFDIRHLQTSVYKYSSRPVVFVASSDSRFFFKTGFFA
jgi:hypothetical protein